MSKDRKMKRTFTYSDDKSDKFWSIDIDGDNFTVNFGKVGSQGQVNTKSFSDTAECQAAADKLINEKIKKGYVEESSADQNPGKVTPQQLIKKYQEKYRDIDDEDASKYYYGDGNAMDQVLGEMQAGINKAADKYGKIQANHSNERVTVHIDEDKLEMRFILGKNVFYCHPIGEPMAEALVVMEKMEESGVSTGISQAINNWAEDLGFDGLGECNVTDTWDMLEGFSDYEDYDDEDE